MNHFGRYFVPLHKRDDYERIRMESKMEMGDYCADSHFAVCIMHASLKNNCGNSVIFQNYAFSLQRERA